MSVFEATRDALSRFRTKSGISPIGEPPPDVPVIDVKIDAFLRESTEKAKWFSDAIKAKTGPLSVYSDYPFPITHLKTGQRLPRWRDLSEWLRVQVTVIVLSEFTLLTFNIKIHPDLESSWVQTGRDIRAVIRDRLRREFDKALGQRREFFFVIEGASKDGSRVKLHIHGCVLIKDISEAEIARKAAGRACGIGIRGASTVPSGRHIETYTQKGPRYVNYLFKAVRKYDDRLGQRRLSISRSATQAGREFWDWITDGSWGWKT